MASVRILKKDIDFLTSAVVSDSIQCILCSEGEENQDKIETIVQDVVSVHQELRQRVAAGKQVPASEKRAYYTEIRRDLLKSIDEAFSELSDIVKE